MTKTEKLVICGAGGVIGGHLVADLLRQGFTKLDFRPASVRRKLATVFTTQSTKAYAFD